ncbi:MAG: MBL fold metallo-hydrolase [Chloroflexi bacterium]|nr:MBL fold metallo-hydrolase [Chloroflexota bacterium]MDA1227152.1 MBL fold metallo-hydrolase [Chloroflexota bacterium]
MPESHTEIAPGIHQILMDQEARPGVYGGVYAPNVYLVIGRDKAVFIDTAYGEDDEVAAHLRLWEEKGKPDIEAIICTHRHGDHIGGAGRLSEVTGGAIACATDERDAIDADLKSGQVGRVFQEGDSIDLGGATLDFIPTPGHTMGSLCIVHRENGVLFSGDMILGTGTTVVSPEHGDMTSYIESMRKLLTYDGLTMIAPGHGPIINTPYEKFQELIDHRLQREEQILKLVSDGTGTVDALLEAIYVGGIHPNLHDTAKNQILSHLAKLERESKVRSDGAQFSAA